VLDRAIELVLPILERTDRLRRYSTRLRDVRQFNPAIAELVACARIARIATATETIVVDPPGNLPDLAFDLNGRRVYAEVYAPKSWRQLDIVDDIRSRMSSHGSSCRFHLRFSRPTTRRSDLAKSVAEKLKSVADQVVSVDAQVATFYARTLEDDWTVSIGSAEAVPAKFPLAGWAHRDDHGPPTFVLGSIDAKYVSEDNEARDAVSDLDQLVRGATNLLIVDLSGRPTDSFMRSRYVAAAVAQGQRHPMLSAVLLTGRSCRPRPGGDFESCWWYQAVANSKCSDPFAPSELALLEKPGLVVPGRADRP